MSDLTLLDGRASRFDIEKLVEKLRILRERYPKRAAFYDSIIKTRRFEGLVEEDVNAIFIGAYNEAASVDESDMSYELDKYYRYNLCGEGPTQKYYQYDNDNAALYNV